MALLKTGSYKNTGTVYLDYKLYAEQIGGSGTSRTIKVTVEFKCGGNPSYPSWYGYPCYWQPYVNSTYGSTGTMKGSESWNTNNGYRSYSQTISVNVGTTSSTSVTVGFITNSTGDDGWDGGASASFSVSSTNTAPSISGSVTADGTTSNKYIPENQGTIALSWPAATDSDGNLAGYRIRVAINGGGYSEIARTNASTRTYTHNVSGYGPGTTFKYAVDAYDSASVWTSGSALSGVLTKNTLIKATLTAPSSIVFNTASMSFSWAGASNQVANTSFSYVLTCNEKTLSRGTTTGTSLAVAIAASAPASGAYMLKSDIIALVSSTSYKGTLTFKLTTTNAYGSSVTDIKTTAVNYQSKPPTPAPVINTADDSPDSLNIWRTVADTKNRYMIPDGTRRIRVSWAAVTGPVGESITYDMFYRLDGGGYISLGNQSGTSYNLVLPTQDSMRTINFMVRAKTSYGVVSSDGVSAGQNLHYYRSPYLTLGKLTRTDTTATLQVMVKSESSIPNINTKGTYVNSTLGGTPVALPLSQAAYSNLGFSNLTSDGVYTITFVYNDSTGFTTSNTTETFKIGANLPAFFVNKYGVGIGGEKADANVALKVNGGGYIRGLTSVEGNANVTGNMNAGSITTAGGNITANGYIYAKNASGGDSAIVLDRGSAANWRFLDSSGNLKIQSDWNGSKGDYFDVITANPNTGDVAINKGGLVVNKSFRLDKEYSDGQAYYHFNNGILVTTNIFKTLNTMFEFYITGNSYSTQFPIDIKVNGYVYNQTLVNCAGFADGYNTDIKLFFNSSGQLCMWLKQNSDYTTFRFKLCTSFGQTTPSYTVTNAAVPSGITESQTITMHQGYSSKNSHVVVERGSNASGLYQRFSDGFQICTKTAWFSVSCTTVWGSTYESPDIDLGNFPAQFSSMPFLNISIIKGNSHSLMYGGIDQGDGLYIGRTKLYRGTAASTVQGWVHVEAMGWWK